MLRIGRIHWLQMVAAAWDAYPLEGCGLLVGTAGGDQVERFVPVDNETASSRLYRLDGFQYLRAAMAADDDGLDIIGVMHSHTHTVPYPSPTDVTEATRPLVPPNWHWVIVGLALGYPELHSFRIASDGEVGEEPIEVIDRGGGVGADPGSGR